MHPVFLTLGFFTLLFQIGVASDTGQRRQCRCLPSDPCWPKFDEWDAFNSSLSGKLLAVRPVGFVCHDPSFSETACENVKANYTSSKWRSDEPGALDQINFEVTPNETCYIDTPRPVTCGQGNLPVYAVAATSPQDIQKGVNFGRTHNLRIVIKNTGHDYLGRSTARGSLQIWTHKMQHIEFSGDFRPEGSGENKGGESVVTIGAGVQLKELYTAALAHGRTLVAGFANTVGAAGGYVQGGGHSAFGPWKGMASDNALQFQVVTADGSHIIANEYKNSDLFWALRGGGGGTFGVVTSVTLRTFPDVPMVMTLCNFTAPTEEYWDFITDFHALLPSISDAGGSGYHFIFTGPPQPAFVLINFFLNHTNVTEIDSLYAPLQGALKSNTSLLAYESMPVESSAFLMNSFLSGSDTVATNTILGSRLISRKFLGSETGPDQLVQVLRKLTPNQTTTFLGHLVAGGQVARNGHGESIIDSALNPAWRKAMIHLVLTRGWENTTPFSSREDIMRNLTEVEMPILKALEPDMGAYVNEADKNEEGWQQVFWGDNYPRLFRIKARWDPTDVFMCKPCVGSERWDDEGICRVD